VVLTFGRFVLPALLIGTIRGQGDHHDDLVLGQLWQAIQPLLASHHAAAAGALVSTTAPAWPASSTSCAPGWLSAQASQAARPP
jgi:hypothetical protein